MTDSSSKRSPATVKSTVAELDQRAAKLRAELQELRQQLVNAQSDLSNSQEARLQEANQKLVLAVLQADSIAEVAVANLAALTELRQREASTSFDQVPADSRSHQQDLQQVNEQLIMSSLSAKASEAQATEAYSQQMKFMAMVAHELRNPLTPLRLATEMLTTRSEADEITINRLSVIINSQVSRMARLIDDLLDGSRLGVGKLRLELGDVDLVRILQQVVVTCQPGMQVRKHHLKVELLPGPLNVRGDPIRLAQIFNNLLDNASKYTAEGGEIALGMAVGEDVVSISVRDNGLGIGADMLPTIFELFVQDARTLGHSSGGLGIGLAVVRDLVEAHGGTVECHSEGRDLGTEFTVRLPLP